MIWSSLNPQIQKTNCILIEKSTYKWSHTFQTCVVQRSTIYVYICMYVCMCVCVCIYIYIYTHTHTHILYFFLWPNNIHFCGYTTFCLSIHQLMSTSFWLIWIMLLWTLMYKFLCGPMFSLFLSKYLGVELPRLCLTFWGTVRLFSKGTPSF